MAYSKENKKNQCFFQILFLILAVNPTFNMISLISKTILGKIEKNADVKIFRSNYLRQTLNHFPETLLRDSNNKAFISIRMKLRSNNSRKASMFLHKRRCNKFFMKLKNPRSQKAVQKSHRIMIHKLLRTVSMKQKSFRRRV